MTTLTQVNEDFDRIFGDAWQPTMPAKPEPMPVPRGNTRARVAEERWRT